MTSYNHIVVLTGAGLSAESGLDTFRAKGGLWAQHDVRDVATFDGYGRNPALVLNFYNERRKQNIDVKPNAAHLALARLEAEHPGDVLIVTQNIDPLHERAGSKNLIHMHGEILKALCGACGRRLPVESDLNLATVCPFCKTPGYMRPDVVWFGEVPYEMDRIFEALFDCDLFLSIGTSGTVYPAAGFVAEARRAGAHTVELNLEPSQGNNLFHEAIQGRATEIVPAYVERLLDAARAKAGVKARAR